MQLTEARSEIVDKERQLERLLSELDNAKQELGAIRQERDYYVATVDESIKDHKHWQVLALTTEKRELMRKRRLRQKAIAENLWMLRRTSLPQLHPAGPPPPGKEEVVVIERLGR